MRALFHIHASLLSLLLLLLALPVAAEGAEASIAAPPFEEDATAPQQRLSGRQIYQCVLDNRFHSYVQESDLISGDRGGATQESRLRMTWSSFRRPGGEPSRAGVLSKTLVKYTEPFDLRYSGYLIINNHRRGNDQFVYLNTSRRIRRVNLRRQAVFGTDFTFEDIVPREIDGGTYQRLPDKVLQERGVYVVDVTPLEQKDSEYSRFRVHVDKQTCVPLLTKYWDDRGLAVKRLEIPSSHVKRFQGIYVPMLLTMRNLQLESYTTMKVADFQPNAKVRPTTFDLRRLESH